MLLAPAVLSTMRRCAAPRVPASTEVVGKPRRTGDRMKVM